MNLEIIESFAHEMASGNGDGHGFDHLEAVANLAKKILKGHPEADRELVLASCYLHDSYDDKVCKDVPEMKARICELLGVHDANRIFEICDHISFSDNLKERYPLDINGQIVQDADRLEAMGATMIVRTLQYGWAHDRVLYDPEIEPSLPTDKTEYHDNRSTTINHFYEKAFLLYELLNTDEAREMGEARDRLMHDFVNQFEKEWEEGHD
ncbi:MAG: HD domain-containing protein [Streptococcaceae bacterium]|jgi:uncharacterized protein|nr:HD domain-containing protein [Streptococcaceae bacterium]